MSRQKIGYWQLVPGRRRPALWAAVLLSAGIVIARSVPFNPLVWGISIFVGLILLLTAARQRPAVMFLTMLGVWLSLGAFRYAVETQMLPADHISHFLDLSRKVRVFGRIADLPDRRQYATNLVLDVRSLQGNDCRVPVSGRILVRVRDTSRHFSYGDFLRFTGKLERPHEARNPGGFDYRRYLFDRGIYGTVDLSLNGRVSIYPDPGGAVFFNRLVIPLREYILSVFREYLPGVPGTLLAGYLIGETRDMPGELYDAYRRSGTLHLLAVSGSNVWLVLGVFWLLFRTLRFPRVVQTVLLLGILVVFCFVTRNDPSVVRAGVMAALVLIGLLFHRRIDMLNIVGVSAVVILLFSPRHLFMAGFQLSYAAVLGILILVPRILQVFPRIARWRGGRWGLALAGSSLAATAATAPILAIHFGMIPVISAMANLVMVPLAGMVTNCAVVLVLLGHLWPWAAKVVALSAKLLADFSVWSVHHFETAPLGLVYWSQPGPYGVFNYVLILVAVAASRYWYRWFKPALFYLLLAAGVFLAARAVSGPAPPVEVMFFDAGWQPLVGIRLPGEQPRLVGTAGAFSPANRHWIIEPFLVHTNWPRDNMHVDTIPRRLDLSTIELPAVASGPNAADTARQDNGITQLQFVCRAGPARTPIADYLSARQSAILILYHDSPEFLEYFLRHLPTERVDILALPSSSPTTRLLNALKGIDFDTLLLFGTSPHRQSHGVGEVWARHFPQCPVFTTRDQGGIRVLIDGQRQIIPMIR